MSAHVFCFAHRGWAQVLVDFRKLYSLLVVEFIAVILNKRAGASTLQPVL